MIVCWFYHQLAALRRQPLNCTMFADKPTLYCSFFQVFFSSFVSPFGWRIHCFVAVFDYISYTRMYFLLFVVIGVVCHELHCEFWIHVVQKWKWAHRDNQIYRTNSIWKRLHVLIKCFRYIHAPHSTHMHYCYYYNWKYNWP